MQRDIVVHKPYSANPGDKHLEVVLAIIDEKICPCVTWIYNKQLSDYGAWVEPYDHTLIPCDCGRLCERGIGLCDPCIDKVTIEMEKDLEQLCYERKK